MDFSSNEIQSNYESNYESNYDNISIPSTYSSSISPN